jgi:hypothetical protein
MILSAVAEYQRQIAELGPGSDRIFGAEKLDAARKHGPPWSPMRWFPHVTTNTESVRLSRAMRRLVNRGLLAAFRQPNQKFTHIRLTRAGKRIAAQLSAATSGNTEEKS